MPRRSATSTSASERDVPSPRDRRAPSTSLGTTNTGHPASSAAAVPVTESSMARHCAGARPSSVGGPQVRIGRGFAARHLVTADRRREVVAANAVQRTLGERPLGVGHQRHRSAFGGKRFQQLLRTVAPRQPAVEQVRGVVVQPADGLGHRRGIELEAQVGVDDPHGVLRRAAHHRCPHLRRQLAAELLVERGQRDVPELFGVDEGAVHVPQHRLHAADCVTRGQTRANRSTCEDVQSAGFLYDVRPITAKQTKRVHPVDEVLPLPKLAAYGFQHVVAFYAGAVLVPIIIAGAIELSAERAGQAHHRGPVHLRYRLDHPGGRLLEDRRAAAAAAGRDVRRASRRSSRSAWPTAAAPPSLLYVYGAVIVAGVFTFLIAPDLHQAAEVLPARGHRHADHHHRPVPGAGRRAWTR